MTALKESAEEAGFVVPPGAYAYFSEAQQVAVFMTPAENSAGTTYLLAAIVDTQHVYLMDASSKFAEWGITGKIAMSELVACLKARGFIELTGSTAPTLIATLRLAYGYLRTQGAKALVATTKLGGAIELMVMPAGLISPSWCIANPGTCETIQR